MNSMKYSLTENDKNKMRAIEQKFVNILDSRLKFWVKDTRKNDAKILNFTSNSTVEEVKRTIKLEFGYRDNEKFRLIYRDTELRIGSSLFDYEIIDSEQEKWSNPYSGVLWVQPRNIPAPTNRSYYT